MRLGYGASGGISLTDYYTSLGVDGRFQYDFSLKMALIATTGYTHCFSNEMPDLAYAPLKAGIKWHLAEQVYILGEAGAAFSTTGEGVSFVWNPGIGVASKYIDISLRHEILNKFNTSIIALRLAYGYKL